MIATLAAVLPKSLAAFAPGVAIQAGDRCNRVADVVASRGAFAEATAPFRQRFVGADERAIMSYWTQFYFATLIAPTLAARLLLGRDLPIGLDEIGCDIEAGLVRRFLIADDGHDRPSAIDRHTDSKLLSGHLRPFIARCAALSGASQAVLWCNAGVMVDFAIRELMRDADLSDQAFGLAETFLSGPERLLFRPHRLVSCSGLRQRRVCCLRFRLPGVAGCGDVCPVVSGSQASARAG